MKTLHVTNCWHTQSGGIATFYRALLSEAEAQGRFIRLVVPGDCEKVEQVGQYGRIYYVPGRPAPFNPGYRLILPQSYLLPGGSLRRIVDEERPDLIECCDKYTLNYFAGLLRRRWFGLRNYRPAVVGLSCERMDDNMARYISSSNWGRRFCSWYMQWLYFPLFDHHIAVSPHTSSELYEVSFGHRCRRGVWVRPMGADCSLFTPSRRQEQVRQRLRAMIGAPEDATLLLYAGRLAPEKNPTLLIETMRILERELPGQFHLLLAGDGPMRQDMERECTRDLPGATYFLGYIQDRVALAEIYANCDLMLHPNPNEPFGIAPLEAMASGIPLVGPLTGGITSYAGPNNAVLLPPEPGAFARACMELRGDPGRMQQLSVAGRATAERFNWPNVAAMFFDLYEDLLATVQGAAPAPRLEPAFYSTYSTLRR